MGMIETIRGAVTSILTLGVKPQGDPDPPVRLDGTFGGFVSSIAHKRQLTAHEFDRLFKGWVFSCTKKRAGALAKQTRRVYRRDTGARGGRVEVDPEHPIVRLFEAPLPTESWYTPFDLFETIEMWLCTVGEAYVYTPRNGGRYPVQAWALPPTLVEPRSEGKRIIDYYEWRNAGRIIRIPPEEMIFFRENAPATSLWKGLTKGMGKLEAAMDQVMAFTSAMDFIKNDLDQNMLPPLFVRSQGKVDPKDWRVWKAELAESYQGANGTREPGMLHQGWDIKTVDLLGGRGPVIELMREMGPHICGVFEVPMPLVTGDYGNQAPAALAEETNIAFERTTIDPQSERYDAVLTRWARQFDPDLIIAHDPVEWQKPEEARADELHRLKTGRATINDLRRESGEQEIDSEMGDVLWIDPLLRPLDMVLSGSTGDIVPQKVELSFPKKEVPTESPSSESTEDVPEEVARVMRAGTFRSV